MDGDCSGAAKLREAAVKMVEGTIAYYECQMLSYGKHAHAAADNILAMLRADVLRIRGEATDRNVKPATCHDYERGRAEALAEAAAVVEAQRAHWFSNTPQGQGAYMAIGASACAIRALATTPPTQVMVRREALLHYGSACNCPRDPDESDSSEQEHIDACTEVFNALEGGTDG